MKIGLIGCGAIGSTIAQNIAKGVIPAALVVVYDSRPEKMSKICELFESRPTIARGIEDLLDSNAGLVVEAASIEAARRFTPKILESSRDIMLMSVGALADERFYEKVVDIAERKGVRIYLPSGAIGALDALKSASVGEIYEVTLETVKPPGSFEGAPYLKERGIDWREIKDETVLYEGTAIEAINKFPSNINVATALSLAGIGGKKTNVRVIANPGIDKNIHKVRVKGEFGEFEFVIKNVPFSVNPKTSYLAALSAIATLKNIASSVDIG